MLNRVDPLRFGLETWLRFHHDFADWLVKVAVPVLDTLHLARGGPDRCLLLSVIQEELTCVRLGHLRLLGQRSKDFIVN